MPVAVAVVPTVSPLADIRSAVHQGSCSAALKLTTSRLGVLMLALVEGGALVILHRHAVTCAACGALRTLEDRGERAPLLLGDGNFRVPFGNRLGFPSLHQAVRAGVEALIGAVMLPGLCPSSICIVAVL